MKTTRLFKLRRKSYRDNYVKAHLEQGLAFQLREMRVSRGLTQSQLAKALGIKSQSAVARLEDPSYGKMSIPTLLKVAAFFDVALITKLVPYSKFLCEIEHVAPADLVVPSFEEEDAAGAIENSPQFKLIRNLNTTGGRSITWGASWPTLTAEISQHSMHQGNIGSSQVNIYFDRNLCHAAYDEA